MSLSSHTARVLLHHDYRTYRVQGVTVAATTAGLWIGYATSHDWGVLACAIISSLTLLGIVLIGVGLVRRVMRRDG